MKALTVSQPFASLIASGEKRIENRTWPTGYRGALAIHAGSGQQYLTKRELEQYQTGCIVAVCTLVDCIRVDQVAIRWPSLAGNEHANGPYCWVLADIRPIEPVFSVKGQLGFWEVDVELP